MDNKASNASKDLLHVSPITSDSKLIVNKNIRTLEDLRKNFQPVQSSVLSEVRSFLPKLATANEDLQKRLETDPDYTADIEHLEDCDAPHIEMNLALVEADYSSEDSSLDSTGDESDDNDDVSCGEVNGNNIKLPKQGEKVIKSKELIHVMDDTDSRSTHRSYTDKK